MKINLRLEDKNDFALVENLTREAFWNVYKPGCDEHLLAHKIRQTTAFVPQLDFVACKNNKIIGNIMYSKANIVNQKGEKTEVLYIGPLSVLPEEQKKGVGSMLINYTLDLAKKMGFRGVILYGNPHYYQRFGFKNAQEYNITTPDGANFDAFMALELFEGSLKGVSGKCVEDDVFKIDSAEVEEFEKQFPYKQKLVLPTQLW